MEIPYVAVGMSKTGELIAINFRTAVCVLHSLGLVGEFLFAVTYRL
jgi:hypothetical protein